MAPNMLQVINNPSQDALLNAIKRSKEKYNICQYIVFDASKIQTLVAKDKNHLFLSYAKSSLNEHVEFIFNINSSDMLFVLPEISLEKAEKTKTTISYSLADVYKMSGDSIDESINIFNSIETYEILIDQVKSLYNKQPTQESSSYKQAQFDALFRNNCDSSAFKNSMLSRNQREKKIVLIVEDQTFSQMVLNKLIGSEYDVQIASNATEALLIYFKIAPDICFLDWHLPDVSGIRFLEYIKQVDSHSFIIMSTSSNKTTDVQEALKKGVDGYITKPFNNIKVCKYLDIFNKKDDEKK